MAEEEEEENKVPKVDPIVFLRDWFKTRVLSSLKCKEDLVNKLVDIEPSAAAVDSFWKESETQRLIVYFKDADLIATTNPPDKFKKKALCFLKLAPVKLDPDNVDSKVIFGDFGDAPLEHLSTVAQEVFLPVITNPRNQHGWPEVITKEVMENIQVHCVGVRNDRPDQRQDAATDAAERIVRCGWSRRGVHHGPDPRAGVRDRHVDQADQGCVEDGPGAGA